MQYTTFYINCISPVHEDYTEDFVSPFQIEGGTVNLPLSFYMSLISQYPQEYGDIPQNLLGRVNWKAGNWVTGIYDSDMKDKVVIRYRNKYEQNDIFESFDYVICAIPFSTLRVIDIKPSFSNGKMQAIKEVDYIDAHKTLFLCSERFWEKGNEVQSIIGGASYTDLPIQSIVYPSYHMSNKGHLKPDEPGVLQTAYSLSLDAVRIGNTEEPFRFEIIKRQVEEVHGLPCKYLDDIVIGYKTINWNNEPWAKGAFDVFYPGQKKVFLREMLKSEYDNRVFFAGEHTSRKHAWMQGALFSGRRTANDLAYYSKINKYNK